MKEKKESWKKKNVWTVCERNARNNRRKKTWN